MIQKQSLVMITARGGSKRIPRKNIKHFLGQPIIKYSIDACINSKCFNEVMVSTDDQEIASLAKSFGAKVPFFRSTKNSNDHATTAAVIEEVIKTYKENGISFKYVCCVYPTAPFITPKKLVDGLKLLKSSRADSVVPVVKFSYPIQRGVKIKNNKIKMVWPENINAMSQNLEPIYHDCGQYYFLRVSSFLKQKQYFMKNTLPIITPETEVQDIDNFEDWSLAEIKYRSLHSK